MGIMDDLRSALRQLATNPGFTAVAVLTLALGIGVNSVMFSLVDAVLFRPLPVEQPEQLVRLGLTDERGLDLGGVSYPLLKDLAREGRPLVRLAGFAGASEVNLSVGEEAAERVTADAVTGNFFPVLGVKAAAGRLLGEPDDVWPGGHPVMVLSEAFWQRRFGGDPGVVGRAVRMNTTLFTIVGVAARGFHGTSLESVPDVWIPLTMSLQSTPNLAQFVPFERRGFAWIDVVGRLADGVGAAQARAQLDQVHARVNQDLGVSTEDDRYDRFRVLPLSDAVLEPGRQLEVARSSWLLIGVAAIVLVIACAVAAGLLLVRGEGRHRELALRQAVGASRGRIVRQLLVESLLLAAAAAALGLLFAQWSADLFLRLAPDSFPLATTAATPVLESRVIAFTSAVALVSTRAFGLLPAWRASGTDLTHGTRGQSAPRAGSLRSASLRGSFVVAQVALCAVLLVGAGLLLRTLGEATRVDLGFETGKALVVSMDVSKSGYDSERGQLFQAQVLDRVRQLPGVRSAALARHVPVQDASMITTVELTSFTPPPGRRPEVAFTPVSSDFFRTMGIRLEQGRDFSRSDAGGPSVLIVNRAFADRFWPGRDALAERVLNFGEQGSQVIGVAANAKQTGVRESPAPMLYVPDFAFHSPRTSLILRTSDEPRAILPAVSGVVNGLDKSVPLFRARTLEEHVGLALAQERVTAALLSGLGLLALALAGIGLYSVIAYTTEVRAREFGVRLALGASPRELLRLVLREGAGLAVTGVVIGLLVAAGASRVLASMLFGVSPTDPLTFLGIAVLLLTVALAASAIPARRAAAVDPVRTLRSA